MYVITYAFLVVMEDKVGVKWVMMSTDNIDVVYFDNFTIGINKYTDT